MDTGDIGRLGLVGVLGLREEAFWLLMADADMMGGPMLPGPCDELLRAASITSLWFGGRGGALWRDVWVLLEELLGLRMTGTSTTSTLSLDRTGLSGLGSRGRLILTVDGVPTLLTIDSVLSRLASSAW